MFLYKVALDLKVDHRNASKRNSKEQKWGFYTMTFKKIKARVQRKQPINANLIHNKKNVKNDESVLLK